MGQVTSARDTPLMQLVASLIAGNARTFLLPAVSSHPSSYLETVNTLRIATRAQNIQVIGRNTSIIATHEKQVTSDASIITVDKFMICLLHFAITIIPTNGCLLEHACEAHSGGACGGGVQPLASELLLQESIDYQQNFDLGTALVADCLYAYNWREA